MKKFITFLLLIQIAGNARAQTHYGFAYAYNSVKKILYVSRPVNLSKYSNCKGESGYTSTVADCLKEAYLKSTQIEAGSSSNNFSVKVVTLKNEFETYSEEGFYTTEEEVNGEIKNIIAKYKLQDYTLFRIEP